jgi:hypothetical protein
LKPSMSTPFVSTSKLSINVDYATRLQWLWMQLMGCMFHSVPTTINIHVLQSMCHGTK